MLKFLILLALLSVAFGFEVPQNFVNENVLRTIDLESHIVRESRKITVVPNVKGQKLAPGTAYYFTIETFGANSTVAWLSVKEKPDEEPEYQAQYEKVETSTVSLPSEEQIRVAHLYKVAVKAPMDKTTVLIDFALVKAVSAFPEVVSQDGRQLVRFSDNVYCPSSYVTKSQKLKLLLSSSSVNKYKPTWQELKPVTKSGKTLTFGPYDTEIAADSFYPLYIHYENNSPALTVTSLTREIWVSYWGSNVAVEEWYALKHSGAKLKGQFSRIDLSHGQMNLEKTSVVQSFTVPLPASVSDVYFRDDIGNVSTSRFVDGSLELTPRFPLFGGWIYTWFHGYNAPLSNFLKTSGGKYVLQAPVVEGIENAPIEDFTLKIVLPEGATDIEVKFPFDAEIDTSALIYTYVDTIGRPTINVNAVNIVDEHSLPFQVTFRYSWINSFRKPFVLTLGMFVVFLLSMIYVRIDYSFDQAERRQSIAKKNA